MLDTWHLGVGLLAVMPLVSLTNIFEIIEYNGLSIRGIDFLFLLAWLALVLHIVLRGKIRRNVPTFLVLIFGLFFISLIGLSILPTYQVKWPELFRLVQTLLWGALALSFVRSTKDAKIIFRSIIIAGAVLALFSIYLHINDPSLHRIGGFFSAAGGEGRSTQASFNEIGALYSLASILTMNSLLRDRRCSRKWKFAIYAGLTLNIIGLILVQSRSAFLGLIVGSFALIAPEIKLLFYYGKLSSRAIIYGTLGLAITIMIILSSYFLAINRVLLTFSSGSSEYVSAMTRLNLWDKGIQAWQENVPHFLLGYGFGSTEQIIGFVTTENFFLNICIWLGLAGLLVTIALLILPLIEINKRPKNSATAPLVVSVLLATCVISMFGNTLVDPFYGGCTLLTLYAASASSYSMHNKRN
ncbi:MAG: O-antigen ligase family protein [Methanothrix sp.]